MKTYETETEKGTFALTTLAGKHQLWVNIEGAKTGQLIEISQRVATEIYNYIMKQGTQNNQQNEEEL